MLRAAVLLLLAANIVFFGWARGWLAPTWQPPRHGEREPQRIAAQIRPEAVRVLTPAAASAAIAAADAADAAGSAAPAASAASAPATPACLEAGPYNTRGLAAAAKVLAAAGITADRWERVAGGPAPTPLAIRIADADDDLQSRLAALSGVAFRSCATR